MATKNTAEPKQLATLALAKALAEGDSKGVAAAIKAGADADAFWIDGKTRLRALAGVWGSAVAARAIKEQLSPLAMKMVPSMKSDGSLWTKRFVEFVARRGYEFHGRTRLQSGVDGSELSGLSTAKAALRMISTKWSRGLEDATCKNSADGKSSDWKLSFRSTFDLDRRLAGFWISFTVDGSGWELVEEFERKKAAQTDDDWPPPTSKYAIAQRDWEGEMIVYRFFSESRCDIERLIKSFCFAWRQAFGPSKLLSPWRDGRDEGLHGCIS